MPAAVGQAPRPFPWHVLLPFLVFVLHSLLFGSWLIDDAGISFAYARNLIHGHGLVAQSGAAPVEGFSNPLWTVLVAPVFIGDPRDPTLALKIISASLVLATYALVSAINRSLLGDSWWARSATAATLLLLSVCTSFVVWTTSGLENPLTAFLGALYCLQLVRHGTRTGRRPASAAVLAGLSAAGLALTRPDGIVYCAAFPGVLALQLPGDRSRWEAAGRQLAVFTAAALLPVLAYTAFRYAYFGALYPNTYYAKGGASARELAQVGAMTLELFAGIFPRFTAPGLAVSVLGALFALTRRRSPAVAFLLPPLVCAWAAFCLLPRDWMGEYRFATAFLLFFFLFLTALFADLVAVAPLGPRNRQVVFLTGAALLAAQALHVSLPRSLAFAEKPTVPFAGVASRFGIRFNAYADELGIAEASLLCPDLGGTLYYSRHRVLDLAGLCDPAIARLINDPDRAKLREHLLELKPTFIRVHAVWSHASGLFGDERFRTLYAPIRERPSLGAARRGIAGVYDGDYVLKSALRSPESLERLRRKRRGDSLTEPPLCSVTARPFPRG